ncbi:uncharacterized protein LOC128334935 [Hemicordylus capensis]|uniref:uncharacterized protein LOC128334935 n=1 Tax=Hemicordylus capensis TaxID=884348 RepID=UPI0023038355|nr:uncharacterized protein LOC128334935 [Hemicordylus capensis]
MARRRWPPPAAPIGRSSQEGDAEAGPREGGESGRRREGVRKRSEGPPPRLAHWAGVSGSGQPLARGAVACGRGPAREGARSPPPRRLGGPAPSSGSPFVGCLHRRLGRPSRAAPVRVARQAGLPAAEGPRTRALRQCTSTRVQTATTSRTPAKPLAQASQLTSRRRHLPRLRAGLPTLLPSSCSYAFDNRLGSRRLSLALPPWLVSAAQGAAKGTRVGQGGPPPPDKLETLPTRRRQPLLLAPGSAVAGHQSQRGAKMRSEPCTEVKRPDNILPARSLKPSCMPLSSGHFCKRSLLHTRDQTARFCSCTVYRQRDPAYRTPKQFPQSLTKRNVATGFASRKLSKFVIIKEKEKL